MRKIKGEIAMEDNTPTPIIFAIGNLSEEGI